MQAIAMSPYQKVIREIATPDKFSDQFTKHVDAENIALQTLGEFITSDKNPKKKVFELYTTALAVNIHNVTTEEEGKKAFGKSGAFMMSVFPLEARESLVRTKEQIHSDVIGDIKSIGFFALASSAVTAVFNVSFIYIVIVMLLFATFDWILGIVPKPRGLKEVEDKGDRSALDRLHMLAYLVGLFIVLSACQVLSTILVQLLDPHILKDFKENYPRGAEYLKDFVGLHTLSALGITIYYMKRITPHASAILFNKARGDTL
jgi:hypothetical protein